MSTHCYIMDTSSFERKRIPVKQYITDSIFAHIQINRKRIPLNIEDYEVNVVYKTLDNEVLTHKVERINSKKGIVGLYASYDLTDKYGEVYGELHIKKNNQVIYVIQFYIDVKKSNIPEGSKPEVDLLSIEQKIKEVYKNLGNVEEIAVENSDNIVNAINKLNKRTENILKTDKHLEKTDIDRILSIFDI